MKRWSYLLSMFVAFALISGEAFTVPAYVDASNYNQASNLRGKHSKKRHKRVRVKVKVNKECSIKLNKDSTDVDKEEMTVQALVPVMEMQTEETKKINIPKETEQMLLKKLERFENTTKFTNKDISLAVLAGQFDTNTKYLSEVINSNFNMNFNAYINKLRIKCSTS
mgnify:CR=1 FL=1